jgi:hypothetical protein
MDKLIKVLLAFSLFLPGLLFPVDEILIDIQVSPNVLNLQSNSVVVTIHTDISYNLVIGSSVTLNGLKINSWKADDRGNFVAKFLSDEVKNLDNLVIGGMNELVLKGDTVDGNSFTGARDIKVINILPAGKK